MNQDEAKIELQRRCNGISNPNHVLEVALQMQKEIYSTFESRTVKLEAIPVYEYLYLLLLGDGTYKLSTYQTEEEFRDRFKHGTKLEETKRGRE